MIYIIAGALGYLLIGGVVNIFIDHDAWNNRDLPPAEALAVLWPFTVAGWLIITIVTGPRDFVQWYRARPARLPRAKVL